MAITACADVARGKPNVADLRYARDVAEGVREAASQAAWRASGDRKAEQTFLSWSMRRDLAEWSGRDDAQPDWSKTHGAEPTRRNLTDH